MSKKFFYKTLSHISPPVTFSIKLIPKPITQFCWESSSVFSGYISLLTRYLILKSRATSVGYNVYIGKYVILKNIQNLSIGDNVSIHDSCYIDSFGDIVIGNNVSIAHQTSLISFNHTWSNANIPIKYNKVKKGHIIIKDDVWIGCGVRIMPGVTINERSVVAAGSIVTKDVPSGSIVAGIPAKIIGNC